MFSTRMTELFGIKYPIMLAGMNWITDPKLVSAVCNAGGLGIFATARCTPEETRQNIREIRGLTDKPFGINQMLTFPTANETIKVAIEEKVPVLNYTLGKPWFINEVHAYGGKVLGTTATVRHAVRAEQLGCDAVVVTGYEAAAHGDVATSLVLLSIVTKRLKVPVIAAGGFYDGRGLAAALALGADGISMGTRFMITQESVVHKNFKQLVLESTEQDTLYSDVFDGMLARVLKNHATEVMMKGGFPLFKAIQGALGVKRLLNLSLGQFIRLSFNMMKTGEESEESMSLLAQGREAAGFTRAMKAIYDGDLDGGMLYAGQDVGGIDDIPSAKELIDRTVDEAEKTLKTVWNNVRE